MSLLETLDRQECWEKYYKYKTSLAFPARDAEELRRFIDRRDYLPAAERIRAGEAFPLPEKRILMKQGSEKKRTVYIYPKNENTVLKLLTYLLIRKYDGLFDDSLYIGLLSLQKGGREEVAIQAALLAKRYMYIDTGH